MNIHLNVPCYFASIEEMKNDYLINKNIESKRQLLISHLYFETKGRPYECNRCSNDKSTRFNRFFQLL